MAMTQQHRDVLRKNRVDLVKNLIIDEEFLSSLLSERILSEDTKEEIENQSTKQKKAGRLLDIIPKRGDKAFTEFIKALVLTHQEIYAEMLDAEMTKCYVLERDGDVMEVDYPVVDPVNSVEPDVKSFEEKAQDILKNMDVMAPIENVSDKQLKSLMKQMENKTAYRVSKVPRGRAVIISNEYFCTQNLRTRKGNSLDVDNLKNLFTALHFTVDIVEHKTDTDLLEYLDYEQKRPEHVSADMFVLFVMSHGVDGHVFTFNGKKVSIESIISYFDGNKCPALSGKPKLFFIQACQEVDRPSGVSLQASNDHADGDVGDSRVTVQAAGFDATDGLAPSHENLTAAVHEKADVLVARSTVSGYVSIRNEVLGTYYVRCLVYVFSRKAHTDHVLDMLLEVSNIMQQLHTAGKDAMLPEKRDTFNKKLYFMPGYRPF